MYNWQAYLSNGKIINSKDLSYPGSLSPWLILVDLINKENLLILKDKFGELPEPELKSLYYGTPHELRPKLVRITNLQLNVNGKIYNSASTSKRSKFQNSADINYFWIFGQADFELTSLRNEEFISFSFLVDNKYRIFQWVDVNTNESWIEICNYDDPRNTSPMEKWI